MNSLLGYGNGSDDELDDSPVHRKMDPYLSPRPYKKPAVNPQDDTNYDEVQMSLSEDSDSESKSQQKHGRDRSDGFRNVSKGRSSRDDHSRGDARRDDRREDKERVGGLSERSDERPRYKDEVKSERSRPREEERPRARDGKEEDREKSKRDEDRTRERGDRFRDEDRGRDRRDDRRDGSREKYGSRDDRYRKERRRSRSPRDGRDRKRSRSPRRSDRSRSRSRERGTGRGRGGFQRRFDRGGLNRTERPEKTGPETKVEDPNAGADDPNKARFFMPGITGRFRDQIEKRKLLWQKKEPESQQEAVAAPAAAAGSSRTTKVWEATTFAQDTDGKVANKFKRLMGIRGAGEAASTAVEVLKKQEEMFTSMEQQYEVARTATHTMRGVGLGFGFASGGYPR